MASYEDNVFINCPFDSQYQAIFYALVFAVHDCGYVARCALEVDDSGLVRIQKIEQMISDCRFGIHDISRIESDPQTQLAEIQYAAGARIVSSRTFSTRVEKCEFFGGEISQPCENTTLRISNLL
jgi:hypothetical protein